MFATPHWKNWLSIDLWTLDEAILLTLNIDPAEETIFFDQLPEQYFLIEKSAIQSWKVKRLSTLEDSPLKTSWKIVVEYNDPCRGMGQLDTIRARQAGMLPEPEEVMADQEQEANLAPLDYILWAIEKNYHVPDEMREFAELRDDNKSDALTEADIKALHAAYLRAIGKSNGEIAKVLYPDHASPTKNKKAMASQLAKKGTDRYLAGKRALPEK